MNFNKWIDTFVSEKELDIEYEFTIESNNNIHFVSLSCLIEFIKKLPKNIQDNIKSKLVYLDFRNANVMNFFNHMAKGYIKSIGM